MNFIEVNIDDANTDEYTFEIIDLSGKVV